MGDSQRQFLRESFYLWLQRFILLEKLILLFWLSLLISSVLMKKAMDSDPEDGNSSESKPYHTSPKECRVWFREILLFLSTKNNQLCNVSFQHMFLSTGCSCDCHSSHVHMGTDTNPSAPVITEEKVFTSSEPLLDWPLLLGMWRLVLDLYCILISGQQGFSACP